RALWVPGVGPGGPPRHPFPGPGVGGGPCQGVVATMPQPPPPLSSPPPLSDDFPVLLGPVRVETRFTATELLVRVFPDDWSIENFEPRPTRAEVAALDAYWTARWAAAGDQARRRAAWQELVTRVPAGR